MKLSTFVYSPNSLEKCIIQDQSWCNEMHAVAQSLILCQYLKIGAKNFLPKLPSSWHEVFATIPYNKELVCLTWRKFVILNFILGNLNNLCFWTDLQMDFPPRKHEYLRKRKLWSNAIKYTWWRVASSSSLIDILNHVCGMLTDCQQVPLVS